MKKMAWRPVSKAAERRYALFLEWYRKELVSRRPDLEPTASLSKAMFASYYHCEKAVKEDKIFERLDVVLRGILSYRSKKYIPTLPGLIKLKQDGTYGIITAYQAGVAASSRSSGPSAKDEYPLYRAEQK